MQANKLFVLLLLLPFVCYSQSSKKAPLTVVLDAIAKQHDVKFSYIDEELVVYALVPPSGEISLKEKLTYIEQHTRLKFEKLSSNYYSIYNDIRMDKPLCGYLIDSDTGLGIENAEIAIAGLNVSVNSGIGGYFKLPVLAPNTITIRHLNYETHTLNPGDLYIPDCPTLYLKPVVHELAEMEAVRYLATGISRKESGELIVRPRKFGILPGLTEPDVLQTMQQIPGITSVDETVSNINVRGGTHDQNLFLWNGVRMFQTGHFFGLISAFNPLPATNISIYKNGSPAFFGESVSSLVDISTHMTAVDSSFTIAAADMISLNLLTHLKLSDKASLQISGRRTYADLLETPTFRDYEERVFQNTTVTDVADNTEIPVKSTENFSFYDFSVQYSQKAGEKHEVLANVIGVANSVDIYQQSGTAERNSNLMQRNFGGSINLSSNWNSNHSTDLQGYVSWYDLDAVNDAIENDQVTKQRNTILDQGIKFRYKYSGINDILLSAGYQLDEIGVTNSDEVNIPEFSRKSKDVSLTHVLIGEARYISPNQNTAVTVGLRGNYFSKFSTFAAEPRVSASHKLNTLLKLEITGEQKSQTVSQIIDQHADFLGIEKRRWVLANNADVPIQKSAQASVGLIYASRGWLASAEGFYKKITGITSDSQGFRNQYEFINATGDYSVAGGELLVQKTLGRFYSWVSYSYNDNHYNFKGFVPPGFVNNFAVSHAVQLAGIYEWNQLRLALGAKWRTGRPVTEPLSFVIDPDNPGNSQITYNLPNSTTLPEIFTVNFSAAKTWPLNKRVNLTASCSVLNVLDRQNIINRFYRINRGNNSVEAFNTLGLGCTPNISMKLYF